MVSEFALVSLTDTQNFLGLNGTDTQRDTWLEGEIQRQTARVEAWLDRKVKARFYRENLNANDDDANYTLTPKNTPILEVVNLYADSRRKFSADTLIDAEKYEVYPNRIEFTDRYPFGYGRGTTRRLEYAAGWGILEIPFSRQRLDLTETRGGEQLTFTLDAGVHTPKEIVDQLNIELNTAGEHKREVSFDWRTRRFTITQETGELGVSPAVANAFKETHSALPLLGFTGSGNHTQSPATGDVVTLDIPSDLKGAVLSLLQLEYDKGSFGRHKSRGLRSIRVSNYQAQFITDDSMDTVSGMPSEIEGVLNQYKDWIFF